MKSCSAFSLALDESTDISDTALLVVFIWAVSVVVEELLDMASLSSTDTGQDIREHVINVVEMFELNLAKLCGITTDGAPSMTGVIIGFTKKVLDAVGAQDVDISHCIIQQENLCTNVMVFAEVMNNVVQCVDHI